MSYKPIKVTSAANLIGIAEVKINKVEPLVRVEFVEGNNSGKVFIIKKSNCPEYVQSGRWVVKLSSKGDEMYSLSPVTGRFRGKVLHFSAAKGKEPSPYMATVNVDNKTYSFKVFNVIFEITQGKCKGMPISCRINYNFAEAKNKEGKSVVGIGHLRSKYTPFLERFLEVTGAWDRGEMEYTDNVLPAFEKRILRAAKEFDIQMVNGWVDALYPLADIEEDLEETPKENEFEEDESDLQEIIDPNELPWEDEA